MSHCPIHKTILVPVPSITTEIQSKCPALNCSVRLSMPLPGESLPKLPNTNEAAATPSTTESEPSKPEPDHTISDY